MPRHASSMSFKPGIEHVGWRGGTSDYWRREARKVVNCPKGLIVHHKDGNYKNNNFENLQIMTQGNHIRLHNLSAFGHRAKKKIRTDADGMADRISEFQKSSIIKELSKIYKDGISLVEPGEMIGSLKGRHAMHSQLETMFKNAKSNVSIMTTSSGLNELHNNHVDLLKKAAGRGVKIRIAASHSKDSAKAVEGLKKFANIKKAGKAGIQCCG